jgi:hypothetical protein
MAHIQADRVKETTTTAGTGTITLAGTSTGYRTFASVMSVNDTCHYAIVDNTTGEWEVGVGTLASSTTLTRTTILESTNANAAVSFAANTKDVYITLPGDRALAIEPDLSFTLPGISTEPVAPTSGNLKIYSKNVGGKMLPKMVGPSGVDTALQTALFTNRVIIFQPQTGTTGTGGGLGPVWISNGTVSHPTPATTAPALSNQMKRTRYANVITTTNQQLGPRFNAASEQMFWRGNAAGLGGFFFYTRFIVELWPAATVRIFAGLTSSASGSVCISDTVLNNTCGLWHDTTDPATGAGAFNFVTRDATTTTKQAITLANAITAGNSYDFTMFCAPNGSTISWRLVDLVNNVTYSNSTSTTLPQNTAFMQPQVQMSNGTANVTATTVAIGICSIYVESDF